MNELLLLAARAATQRELCCQLLLPELLLRRLSLLPSVLLLLYLLTFTRYLSPAIYLGIGKYCLLTRSFKRTLVVRRFGG